MRLVLATGVFDLLHVSHIRHLRAASEMGTRLVVGVTSDEFVGKAGRPIIPQGERLEMILALGFVDQAMLVKSAYSALVALRPHVWARGHEYRAKGNLPEEDSFCEEHGVVVRYTQESVQSTTGIIERVRA